MQREFDCLLDMVNLNMKQKGFTLIELLVVIAIIGLLASVVLISLNSARAKARDTARKATLRQLQKAIELYRNANGSYPVAMPCFASEPGTPVCGTNGGNWIPGLTPTYLSILPRDPVGGLSTNPACTAGGWTRSYIYESDGTHYKLFSNCAPEILPLSSSDAFYDP